MRLELGVSRLRLCIAFRGPFFLFIERLAAGQLRQALTITYLLFEVVHLGVR